MGTYRKYSKEEARIIKGSGGGKATFLISMYSGISICTIYKLSKILEKNIDHEKILREIKDESKY
jgi:hypothetical protein